MDREQEEMQFLGIFGMYREAYKLIISWRKIFSQITLALLLPLSFILLAHMEATNLLNRKIIHDKIERQFYNQTNSPRGYNNLSEVISADRTFYWFFQAAYLTVYLILSLLSTSAVVYTVACIYTGKDLSFKKVMSVVPKVWKRLVITFLCTFVAYFAYFVVFLIVVTIWGIVSTIAIGDTRIVLPILYIIIGFYLVGYYCLSIIWHLASIVSVLEESCGFGAMIKSQALVKGKVMVIAVIFFFQNASLFVAQTIFQKVVVVNGWSLGMAERVLYGVICLLLLLMLMLFGLVIQTVIYFVCKSYHHENIDKSALSDHLEVYLGEYVPLKSKDVQLEHFEV